VKSPKRCAELRNRYCRIEVPGRLVASPQD
jgi:hypothetical protein